jgi:hypothetical protein
LDLWRKPNVFTCMTYVPSMEATQLSETCPQCGAAVFVIQESQPSMLVTDGQVLVPVTTPVCANGHEWHSPRETA